jgi:hypothetical protein
VGTRSGKEFLSIKVSPQREKSQQEPQSNQSQSAPAQTFSNDDVPF